MPYEVVNEFRDLKDPKDSDDNKVIYTPRNKYPREGDYAPDEKRIKELSVKHKKYKRVFIKEVEESNTATESKSNKKPSSKK